MLPVPGSLSMYLYQRKLIAQTFRLQTHVAGELEITSVILATP